MKEFHITELRGRYHQNNFSEMSPKGTNYPRELNPNTENLSSDEEADFKENWDEQLELEWDDSLIDTPLSNAR